VQAIQTTTELFRERGASVQLDAPARVPMVRADPDRLMQVLLNLLSNAAKFLPRQGGVVQVRLRPDERELTVAIQDNGSGVPPGQEGLIFEKFRQGGEIGKQSQGTGLGLPICRRIVEHLGGRLWLQPMVGAGACFAFSVPWPAPQGKGPTHPSDASADLRQDRRQAMNRKVLIADDEPNILVSLEFLMKREGYDVIVARDGQQALEAIVRERLTWS
jgi:CheY-like chemotaxis protein